MAVGVMQHTASQSAMSTRLCCQAYAWMLAGPCERSTLAEDLNPTHGSAVAAASFGARAGAVWCSVFFLLNPTPPSRCSTLSFAAVFVVRNYTHITLEGLSTCRSSACVIVCCGILQCARVSCRQGVSIRSATRPSAGRGHERPTRHLRVSPLPGGLWSVLVRWLWMHCAVTCT